MPLKKNDIIPLTVETCTAQGSGIGRHEGMTVFVPMTAVGDEIEAHILKVKPTYAFAKVHKIIKASPHRVETDCAAYAKCGGCVFRHMTYEAEAGIKADFVKDCLNRIGKIEITPQPILAAEGRCGYRNKAQFPVAETENGVALGFYSAHSHRVTECRFCPLQPAEFEEILNGFAEYLTTRRVSIYNETNHRGLVRHIYLRKAEATGQIMACAVINGNSLPDEAGLVDILRSRCPQISSILVNTNKDKTNVILGKACRTLYGSDTITDVLCGLKFRISPLSFYQVNRAQAQRLYEKAAEFADLDKSQTLLDLYCGAGTIGLSMADKVKEVIGVEIVPEAIEDAKINAALNGIQNARFLCADAAEAAEQLKKEGVRPHVVVLDPPRKGCAEELLHTVKEMAPEKIVYISCDPSTQARDAAILTTLGYRAEKACPVDLFPGTGHCESVVLFSGKIPDIHINSEINLDELDATAAETKATYQEI